MIELGIAPIGWTNDDLPEIGGDITFEQCIMLKSIMIMENIEELTAYMNKLYLG